MTTCKICQQEFAPARPLQAVCSLSCAKQVPKQQRKHKAAQDRARKEAIKPRSKWLGEAQQAFNAFIRARDAHLPCVSCGRMHNGQWHAGHYLSTGARPELRFDEANCHKQCQPCNTHLHGNLIAYRLALVDKIGQDELDRLIGPAPTRKWTVEDLKAIKAEYRQRLREIA